MVRYATPAEVPIVAFALVPYDHPDLEVIKQAYSDAGAGLGIDFSGCRPKGKALLGSKDFDPQRFQGILDEIAARVRSR